jgi:hypothetical protein
MGEIYVPHDIFFAWAAGILGHVLTPWLINDLIAGRQSDATKKVFAIALPFLLKKAGLRALVNRRTIAADDAIAEAARDSARAADRRGEEAKAGRRGAAAAAAAAAATTATTATTATVVVVANARAARSKNAPWRPCDACCDRLCERCLASMPDAERVARSASLLSLC